MILSWIDRHSAPAHSIPDVYGTQDVICWLGEIVSDEAKRARKATV